MSKSIAWVFHAVLRCYPAKFGLKLVELFHEMTENKSGMPVLPEQVPCAEDTFSSMQYEDFWEEADMISVCRYLRAGVHLRIPETFRKLLPKRLWKYTINCIFKQFAIFLLLLWHHVWKGNTVCRTTCRNWQSYVGFYTAKIAKLFLFTRILAVIRNGRRQP